MTFIDCCSRLTWVYLMKGKNEVFSYFQQFHKMIRTQFDAHVKILRTDYRICEWSLSRVFEVSWDFTSD